MAQAQKKAELEAFVKRELDPRKAPKKHPPGSLTFGTPVWYRGERFYIEGAPKDWKETHMVHISSVQLRPNGENTLNRESFAVHADTLDTAPVTRTGAVLTPLAAARREERAKTGARDIGDEVAVMLRDCKSLDDVYKAGAKFLKVPMQELLDRYKHLNPGQQRMNIGNRMRAKWKKENGRG